MIRLALALSMLLLVAASAEAQWISGGSSAGGGSGSVTQINTSAPLGGGPINVSGTVTCTTCATSAASLTNNQLVFGAGSQGLAVGDLTGDITTSGGKATTLKNTGPGVTSCGDATHSCSATIDIQGRITALSNVLITGTLNTTGSPLIHQVTLFSSATSLTGLAVGSTSGAFLRNVAASDPAWSTLILPNAGTQFDVPLTTATNTWGYDTGLFTYNPSTGVLKSPAYTATGNLDGTLTLTNVTGLGHSFIEKVGNPAADLTFIPPIVGPSGTQCRQATISGSIVTESYGTCGSASGNTTSTALTTGVLPKASGANSIVDSSVSDNGSGLVSVGSGPPTGTLSTGLVLVNGTGSGVITFQPQTAAGTYNFNWPTTAGSSGQPLLSGGGGSTAMLYGTVTGNTTKFATSTGSLTTNNCAKWDANGNAVDAGTTCGGGSSVMARVTKAASQTITAGATTTAIIFDTDVTNADGLHSTVTNNTRITNNTGSAKTCTASATAQFTLGTFTDVGSVPIILNFKRNGSTTMDPQSLNVRAANDSGTSIWLNVSTVARLANNDYLEVIAQNGTNANLTIAAGSDYTPIFAMVCQS